MRRHHQGHAGRTRVGVYGDGRQFHFGHTGHRGHRAALGNCALTVQVSTKLNRSHLVTGRTAVILRTLRRTDKDIANGVKQLVSVEDSIR
jgi:hypothetical protein